MGWKTHTHRKEPRQAECLPRSISEIRSGAVISLGAEKKGQGPRTDQVLVMIDKVFGFGASALMHQLVAIANACTLALWRMARPGI